MQGHSRSSEGARPHEGAGGGCLAATMHDTAVHNAGQAATPLPFSVSSAVLELEQARSAKLQRTRAGLEEILQQVVFQLQPCPLAFS